MYMHNQINIILISVLTLLIIPTLNTIEPYCEAKQ